MRDIDAFVAESRSQPLSYDRLGMARDTSRGLDAAAGSGWTLDEHSAAIGSGVSTFARAKRALLDWRQFDLGWIEAFPKFASIEPGTVVAVVVRHAGFWSVNGCRVVYRIGDANELGFAYGTLVNHAECGEEIFSVQFDPAGGTVSYHIRAVSRPRAALARLGYPLVRALQHRFRVDSAGAMARAVR